MRIRLGTGASAKLLVLLLLFGTGCEKGGDVTTGLGLACAGSADCSGSLICLTDFPDGYCSADCTADADCDLGLCVSGQCLTSCGDDGDCREGYSCVHADGGRACAPPGLGYHGLGDTCTGNEDCDAELSCLVVAEEGSQCTETCTSVLNCGAGADCVNGLCRRTCGGESDCQGGQVCASTPDGRICAPVPPLSPIGGPCVDAGDCAAGLICLTDAPDGYCTRECSGASECAGGICHDGFCFSGCSPSVTEVDVLFVIDDSAGMVFAQQELLAAVPTLITAFDAAGVDYRLGVVSTDVSTGTSVIANCHNLGGVLQNTPRSACDAPPDPWVTSTNVGDPAAAFACIAALGEEGCGFEQPLEALQLALSDSVNPGFVRSSAHLMIVLLTTEDDCSAQDQALFDNTATQFGEFTSYRCFDYGITCDGAEPNLTNCRTTPTADGGVLYPISRYVSQLEGVKGSLSNVTLVAVAGPETPVIIGTNPQNQTAVMPSCQTASVEAQPSVRLGELLDATAGHFHSICEVSYDDVWQPFIDQVSGGGCRPGYQCTVASEGSICEPE